MKTPFFSIITPTYNRGYIISKAIESVLNQKFDNWEMIIIDDGSTDNTEEVVKKYQQNSEKIKYIKLEKNMGPNVARNLGSERASGEWLVFLDSDDQLTPDALENISYYIQKHKDVSFFIFACKDLDGKIPLNIAFYEGYIDYLDFLCKIKGEALPVIKREVFIQEKFLESIR